MPRWVGVDYGTRRIGLAISDPGEVIASPVEVLDALGSASGNAERLTQWAREHEAGGFVVGLPLSMDGSDSEQTRLTRRFARRLRETSGLPLELWDERLSTFQADELIATASIPRSRRRRIRDAIAASVILQSFLDAPRSDTPAE